MLDDTDLTGKDVVIFGNIDQENSMRIAQKLLDMDRGFVFYGYTQQGSHRLPGYVFNPVWQDMVHSDPGFAHAVITLYRTAEGWRMYEGIWSKLP
jgi:hypothetical protein